MVARSSLLLLCPTTSALVSLARGSRPARLGKRAHGRAPRARRCASLTDRWCRRLRARPLGAGGPICRRRAAQLGTAASHFSPFTVAQGDAMAPKSFVGEREDSHAPLSTHRAPTPAARPPL